MRPAHWTKSIFGIILLAHVFYGNLCLGQNDDANGVKSEESIALREAQVAIEDKASRYLELELEVKKLRRDNEKLRSKYAALLLKSRKSLEHLQCLELQALNLLQDKDDRQADFTVDSSLQALELAARRLMELRKAIEDYRNCVGSVVDVMQPSQTIRNELSDFGGKLDKAMSDAMRPLSTASSQSRLAEKRCSVLEIQEELEVVLVDRGSLSGMKPGKIWIAADADGLVTAKFMVVDVRAELSSLAFLEGRLDAVAVGSVLAPEKQ